MIGHAGEIYFAVLKPTSVLQWQWNQKLVGVKFREQADGGWITAEMPDPAASDAAASAKCADSQYDDLGLILDLKCPANVKLLKELLETKDILKAEQFAQVACDTRRSHLDSRDPNSYKQQPDFADNGSFGHLTS